MTSVLSLKVCSGMTMSRYCCEISCSAGGTSHCRQGRRKEDEGRAIRLQGEGRMDGSRKRDDPGLAILAALAAVCGGMSDSSRVWCRIALVALAVVGSQRTSGV
jgi:hypothetical protein